MEAQTEEVANRRAGIASEDATFSGEVLIAGPEKVARTSIRHCLTWPTAATKEKMISLPERQLTATRRASITSLEGSDLLAPGEIPKGTRTVRGFSEIRH